LYKITMHTYNVCLAEVLIFLTCAHCLGDTAEHMLRSFTYFGSGERGQSKWLSGV
jgi:hypothetical protein